MAQILCETDPIKDQHGRPIIVDLDAGWRMAPCKITIPTGSTYEQADRCRMSHSGTKSFDSLYGSKFIRQIIFSNGFANGAVASGEVTAEWEADTQTFSLYNIGNNGTGTGNGGELGSTAFTGTVNAEAWVFFK